MSELNTDSVAESTMDLSEEEKQLFFDTMFRITDGLPGHELELIRKEASECEAALKKEIEILEAALAAQTDTDQDETGEEQNGGSLNTSPIPVIPVIPPEYDATNTSVNNYLPTADKILDCELSPLDRYFTVSALIGRLREPFDTPPPPHSGLAQLRLNAIAALEKKKNKNNVPMYQVRKVQSIEKYKNVLKLKELNEIYTEKQVDPSAMLALVKRISNHRTAAVFRKAVNPLEAPGYTDRILFPTDLTLIKRFVMCGYIQSFEELHQNVGLICHNCVKFNGRDSDYCLLTREFENYVDDSFLDFMQKQKEKASVATQAFGPGEALESTEQS
mmetsp:Transcript_2870/g.5386  ORF Transcript_2870/g.5386 Transcript_2870/m.5386 type:complete len:332 (+) Transcript_2870:107-1102(+)